MRSPTCSLRFVRQPGIALVAFGVFLSYTCGGCLSNRYTIPQPELARLAQLPPEQRGQKVHVVQQLGERRADAIDGTQPPPPTGDYGQGPYAGQEGPPPAGYVETGVSPHVGVLILPGPGPVGHGHGHGFVGGAAPGLAGGGAAPGIGGPLGRAPRVAPATTPAGGVGGSKLGSGKSGGGGKDDLAVFLIVLAVVATVGMVATEGARYDGHVALYPWQNVYLKDTRGQVREVPLAQLTPADAATAREAMVMDDEGWGMMRLGRRPLDRKGFAFKLNLGGFHSSSSALDGDGAAFGVQLGYFPHRMVGILGSWNIAGGSDAIGDSFSRNNVALEAQVIPLSLWRLHLGGFAHAGMQYAHDTPGGTRDGQAFGGGVLLELALTTRLALSFRADHTSAKVGPDGGWQAGQTYTAGVSIY